MDPPSVRTPRRGLLAPTNFDFSISGERLRAERAVFVSLSGKERVARWGQVSTTHRLRAVSRREECGKDFGSIGLTEFAFVIEQGWVI